MVVVAACTGAPAATDTAVAPSAVATSAPDAVGSSAPSSMPRLTVAPSDSADSTPPTAQTEAPPTPLPPCPAGAPATTFKRDAIVCVAAGPLRLRSKPSTADDSVKFEPLLQTGQRLFVMDGPTNGSGYGWYQVQATPGTPGFGVGWVAAAAKDGTPWLALVSVSCPPTPALRDLVAMDAMERLHCFGSRAFTFTDTVTWGPMCGDGVILESPAWMAGCASMFWWGGNGSGLVVGVPPELATFADEVEPDAGFTATITAHMDDSIAGSCKPSLFENDDVALRTAGVVLVCRTTFIATAFQRVSP
jgi:hypothetical protein